MEIDILIDELTDCLIERNTGKKVATEYFARNQKIQLPEFKNWKFNWSVPEKEGYTVYELFLRNDDIVQGRIACKIDGGVADVSILESAPHNFGHIGKYKGVGGHLFAIACQVSFEANCDGVVAFTAKSGLVEYYRKELHAIEIMPQRMVIFEDSAQILLEKYELK